MDIMCADEGHVHELTSAVGSGEHVRARDLMERMVATSQRPGSGNLAFVDAVSDALDGTPLRVSTVPDPELGDRALLVVDVGAGAQSLVAISHSDVVGVDGQVWRSDPWTLHEQDGRWYGRGVCDTHGSGVAMLLAALRDDVAGALTRAGKHVRIIFTYDEEATSKELSMRGARVALGELGAAPSVTARHFVAGEPTEIDGAIVPMRGHKGRWLAHFTVSVKNAGHVADIVENAFMVGADVVQQIGAYARTLRYGGRDPARAIYNPPHSTIQVSAVDVKHNDWSTTPQTARFTVDMRTLPDTHADLVGEITDLLAIATSESGADIALEVVKDAPGSATPEDAPIVAAATDATGCPTRGFNGGDEGRIMRLTGGLDGVTLGPGDLRVAHTANEHVEIAAIFRAAEIYAALFRTSATLP